EIGQLGGYYMSSEATETAWDFTPAIRLIYSLTPSHPPTVPLQLDREAIDLVVTDPAAAQPDVPSLGNFTRLWQELGKPCDLPPPVVKVFDGEEITATSIEAHGQNVGQYLPLPKSVRWRDEDGVTDLEDADSRGDSRPARLLPRPGEPTLPRQPRKKTPAAHSTTPRRQAEAPTQNDAESETELPGLHGLALRKGPTSSRAHASGSTGDDSGFSSASPPKSTGSAVPGWPVSNPFLSGPRPFHIEPLSQQSSAQRKASLVIKLLEAFPAEQSQLRNLAGPPAARGASIHPRDEIHVFIDCSNIMIGYFDTLKRTRGIPPTAHVRRVPMSFHSLALILERGRPAHKRVLVGSKPLTPTIREAQDCGYQISILDRVMKAREPSPRKTRNQANGHGNGNGTSGLSSGSETAGPRKLVEQAVDEILHLKMLESLVDAKVPATMVLATGDAAEAEYSEGFFKMVERALEKGWKVELASFSQNLSFTYRKKAFRQKWKDRFVINKLDDYSEQLLDL
ncbi:MAG: hypothetical protein M1838_004622, partial [Thelocarpon superellum]